MTFQGAGLLAFLLAFLPAINVFLRDSAAPNGDSGLLVVVDLSLLLNANDVTHLCRADVLLELPFSDLGNPLLFAVKGIVS